MYDNSHYTQLNLLLPPTWLTLTLCPSTQHRRLADWSRDRQAGAAHVTTCNPDLSNVGYCGTFVVIRNS